MLSTHRFVGDMPCGLCDYRKHLVWGRDNTVGEGAHWSGEFGCRDSVGCEARRQEERDECERSRAEWEAHGRAVYERLARLAYRHI